MDPMHDAAYKLIFSRPHMVADLLRGFRPDGAWLDFDSATLEPLPASKARAERRAATQHGYALRTSAKRPARKN